MEEALQRGGLSGSETGGTGGGRGPGPAAAQNGESPPARQRLGGRGPACLPSSVSPEAVRIAAHSGICPDGSSVKALLVATGVHPVQACMPELQAALHPAGAAKISHVRYDSDLGIPRAHKGHNAS